LSSTWGRPIVLTVCPRELTALAVLPGAIEALSGWLFKPPFLGRGGGIRTHALFVPNDGY
jgi:hypothetical protein